MVPPDNPSPLFVSRTAVARLLDCSRNFVAAMDQRGEIPSWHVGARVLYPLPALQLRALGVTTPEQAGQFCRGAGIRDLAGLLEFLGVDGQRTP